MLINRKQWKENQYSEEWSFNVESEKLSKIFGAKLIPTKTKIRATDDKRDEKPTMDMLNIEEIKVNCLQTRCAASPTLELCLRPGN